MKKIVILIECILLVGTFFILTPNTVSADLWENGFFYTVSNNEATITGYNGTGGAISIPSTLDGYPTVHIGNYAFYDCSSVTSVTIGRNVTTIGDSAFQECSVLTSVTIPDSVTYIGHATFSFCSSLTSIVIPDSVTTIGRFAFSHCSSMTTINVSMDNMYYASVDGVFYNKAITTLIQCPGAKAGMVNIYDSVTTIEDYAFYDCSSVTSVTIGRNVTTIGFATFFGCFSLTCMVIPNNVTTIGEAAFESCSSLIFVTIGSSVTTIGDSAFMACSSLTSVIIPNSITTIADYTFDSCSSLTSVIIPDSVTTIGRFAFAQCSSLTTVTIPDSVTTIGNDAFRECSALTSAIIGSNVTTIGYRIFCLCNSLTSITFLGLVAPTTVGLFWILGTPVEIRGHAYAVSNFPPLGGNFYGLTMGEYILENNPPYAPSNPSPANGSTGVSVTANLEWSGGDPDVDDTVTYDVYFGTTSSPSHVAFNLSGLIYHPITMAYNIIYYWRIVAWDNHGAMRVGQLWHFTTMTAPNNPPIFGTPSPANESINNPLNLIWSIPINDPEGNLFSWTIQCSNGQTNSDSGATNGTKTLALSDLAYLTTYKIWVNATDPGGSGLYTCRWYLFTTKTSLPPIFGTPTPSNGSTSQPLSLSWSIPISDPEGNSFNWWIQCSNKQTNSGSGASNGTKTLALSGLAYLTTYKVWVNATDPTGSGLYTRRWYTFTTKGSTPPVLGTPSPANGSIGNPLSFNWSIPINDPEGDVFSWTIQCSNGQQNSGNYVSNGTKTLPLTGLVYSTTYKVWVNATDPGGSGLYTCRWYTFTTKANQPPDEPSITGPNSGKPNIAYQWNFTSTDPNNEDVYYQIDWGDGTITDWLGVYHSGEAMRQSHAYDVKGTYTIKCKAKDIYGAESDWGTLSITMPLDISMKMQQPQHIVILRFVQNNVIT